MDVDSRAMAEMARQKTLQFNMRMRPELKEAAEKAAAADMRSIASLIEKLLTDHCRERGFEIGERRERKPSKPRRGSRQARTLQRHNR
jgi:hypothetical protein